MFAVQHYHIVRGLPRKNQNMRPVDAIDYAVKTKYVPYVSIYSIHLSKSHNCLSSKIM